MPQPQPLDAVPVPSPEKWEGSVRKGVKPVPSCCADQLVAFALLLCALCFLGLDAQCPEPNTLKDAEGKKICARMFEDSNYYYEQSCGGQYIDAYPGDDVPIIPWSWNNRISSLVVNKLCSLTVWSRIKKNGSKRKFSSGIVYRLKDVQQGLFGSWENDISAYYCVC
ncbi:hypothetical protein QTP70_009256 [Hemibagrus guttatus]|uniref:Syncollin n=1 Tax=Hemibagrus guttatus TaxID=175788 RepID=A0AAE0QLE8_9TELE|nr:hypothetical protein QTP70_009256 [Hemibagrus guttatus]